MEDKIYDGKNANLYTMDEVGKFDFVKGKSFKIFNWFYLYYEKGSFWFRLFGGYGISAKSLKRKHFIMFSERIGKTKYCKLFGWKFRILKPHKYKSK